MSSVGTNTGIGHYTNLDLLEKVRIGLSLCKTDCAFNCGNCPYYYLKNEKIGDISKCTSALAKDAEEYIDSLIGDSIKVVGAIYHE